jgi:hypothetical protein
MKSNLNLLYLSLIILFLNVGCKKTVEPPEPEPEKGTVYMHLHTFVGINEVDLYNIVYTDENDRKISVSISQLYMSNIQLVKADGSLVSIPDTIILKVQDQETYAIGNVPAGNYKSIRFNVGLDPTSNAKTPTSSDSDELNHSEMWFGSSAQPEGYVFFNIQGKIDTTSDASGTIAQMQPFVYKIGTNANLKQVTMPDQTYTVSPNQAQYIHLYYDVSKLFNGIQLNQQSNLSVATAADNSGTLAEKIRNNIPSMFTYEQQ